MILIAIICLLYTFLTLFQSRLFSFTIDNIIQGIASDNALLNYIADKLGGTTYLRSHLYVLTFFLVCVNIINALLMFSRYTLQTYVGERMTKNLRDDLYDHIQKLPYSFHTSSKSGELIQRCTSDVDTIKRFFSSQIYEVISIFATMIMAIIILLRIDVSLAIIGAIAFPLVLVYSYFFHLSMKDLFKDSDEKEEELSGYIQEALTGVRVIKAFNRERQQLQGLLKHSQEYVDKVYKWISHLGSYWGFSYCICMLAVLMVILMGVKRVNVGTLSVGELYLFITYETMVLFRMRQLGRILSDFSKLHVSSTRLYEIKQEVPEDLYSGSTDSLDGDIIFKNVSFAYSDDPDNLILKDINLEIKKGETVAIIGPTGSGKSSLIHLLVRLYDLTGGEIYINNLPIENIQKKHLRESIGIVLQEPFLFSKSIYDNIAIAKPDSNKSDIYKASKIANVHDVIESFDKGYETEVGERGVTLSGGQKQRIAIARTLINNSPIIIFDDSLSAVDAATDADIRKSLKTLQNKATMIIITQRINSAKDADKIIVLQEGRVSQSGTHEQLIKEDGLYSRVYKIQTAGEIN